MGREQGTADARGLLMVPPALHEELVRSDAERQVIREKMADHWRHVSTELLGLLRNVGECDLGLYVTFSEWVENACAYWATQQTISGRRSPQTTRRICQCVGERLQEMGVGLGIQKR